MNETGYCICVPAFSQTFDPSGNSIFTRCPAGTIIVCIAMSTCLWCSFVIEKIVAVILTAMIITEAIFKNSLMKYLFLFVVFIAVHLGFPIRIIALNNLRSRWNCLLCSSELSAHSFTAFISSIDACPSKNRYNEFLSIGVFYNDSEQRGFIPSGKLIFCNCTIF